MAFIRQVLIKLLLCCDRGRINRAVGVTGRAYLLAGGGLGGGRGVLGFRLHRRHPLLHVQFALLDPEISPRDQLTACWCGYINIIWRARPSRIFLGRVRGRPADCLSATCPVMSPIAGRVAVHVIPNLAGGSELVRYKHEK
jgi:hypothetical protein